MTQNFFFSVININKIREFFFNKSKVLKNKYLTDELTLNQFSLI